MVHICFLSKTTITHCVGGVPDLLNSLAKGLVKAGHKVSIISTSLSKTTSGSDISDNFNIYYLRDTSPGKLSSQYFRKIVEMVGFIKPDIVHSMDAACYGLLRSKTNIPVITTFHGTSYDEWRTRLNTFNPLEPIITAREMAIAAIYGYRYFTYERFVGDNSTALIATSKEQVGVYNKIYKPKHVYTVYNGIDTGIFKPMKEIIAEPEHLLAVARLEVEKGVQNVIRAMYILRNVRPNLKLTIVGDGYYKNKLVRLVKKLGLSEKVSFKGNVNFSELPVLYNKCSIFVNHTNRQNGYDLTNAQAMACGKPVISTNIGSYPTLINDTKDGYLIPLKNIRSLAMEINSVLMNKTIGTQAIKKIQSNFTLDLMVNRHIAVYKEVLQC